MAPFVQPAAAAGYLPPKPMTVASGVPPRCRVSRATIWALSSATPARQTPTWSTRRLVASSVTSAGMLPGCVDTSHSARLAAMLELLLVGMALDSL
jgi:hypothetical protein